MNRPLNILLTNSNNLYAGGEFYVFELARTLRARGHNVWVACRPDNLLFEKCRHAGVTTLPVNFPAKGELATYVKILRRYVRDHNINIVHTNVNYDRTAGAFAAKQEKKIHVANVHSFHSIQHNLTHWVRNRWATDCFIVDGICVRDLLIREDAIPASKVAVVHLGVDPESMRRDEGLRHKIRSEFGFNDTHTIIGTVGRLVPFKGQEFLLRAFASIAHTYPDARLLIVGDGVLMDSLNQLSQDLHIQHFVSFAGFRDDLPALYSAFDIYCHPSVEYGGETFPFAVLQALSQQLPVIVTRVGDVAEMVEEGKNGFLVQDKDPTAIAEKLTYFLSHREQISLMGEHSRQYLLQRFTTNIMVDAIEKVYHSLIEKTSS
jgi:glycosyltransferase involved in cell wall biosynthesis